MRPGAALTTLVVTALATYPALVVGWCVTGLLGADPAARELGRGGHPGAVAAVVLVLVGTVAVGNAVWTALRTLRQTRRFRRWVDGVRVGVAGPVAAVARELGVPGRVKMVALDEPLAVTAGLLRPYIVVSTGLLRALSAAELHAVLAHEQVHARRRDPLRLLLGQVLAAHLWFLPIARDVYSRARLSYELAADRQATYRYGRAALAGALLRVVSAPAFGVPFADAELLEARVAQLESGRPPRPAPVPSRRSVLTLVAAMGFLVMIVSAWLFMVLVCPC
ncbi:MAG: M48 family metalloprotease [Pseudonocardiaceae bacterium]|nr:M48 family metalloprotease [Pseudonocardiaceae bacterium]